MKVTHLRRIGNLAVWALGLCSVSASVSFDQLNAAFEHPVWADENLWDDADADVAARLKWPRESQTSFDASYRLYPSAEVRAFGTRPFSLVLYGEQSIASQISIVFANKGDVEQLAELTPGMNESQVKREVAKASRDFKKFITRDEELITSKLTALLGEPTMAKFGQGRNTTERVRRWDWNGHAILLAAPRAEYVALRVVPTAVADGEDAERVTRADMKERMLKRITRRENGDVILTDIPMVNQGPKGYCSPASWERAMRYLGIPADMYILAMAASTDVGGGTMSSSMMFGINDVIRRNGRRIVNDTGRVTTRNVANYIEKGLPMMWQMVVVEDLNTNITARSQQRKTVTDWMAYQEMLKPWRSAARRIRTRDGEAHICMIIGYNEKTNEIAISDSWGEEFEERWITEEEASVISNGGVFVISW